MVELVLHMAVDAFKTFTADCRPRRQPVLIPDKRNVIIPVPHSLLPETKLAAVDGLSAGARTHTI